MKKAGPQQFSEPEVLFNQAAKTQICCICTGAVDNNLHTGEYALGYYYDLIRKEAKAKTISDYAEAAESYIDTSKLDDAT